jgi:hypothetical protein
VALAFGALVVLLIAGGGLKRSVALAAPAGSGPPRSASPANGASALARSAAARRAAS